MSDVTQILEAAALGDTQAAADLLPLVYDELRRLAAARLAAEPTGNTLQPTALVHEAFLRLIGDSSPLRWDSRGHFFAAAAEAMRRILVENARRKQAVKHGGGKRRVPLEEFYRVTESPDDLLDLHDALTRFAAEDPDKARLVELRFFAGLSTADAAAATTVSRPRMDDMAGGGSLTDTEAVVTCTWDLIFVGRVGGTQHQAPKITLRFQKTNGTWIIVDRR
jgi:RNA polymerase sigma factor (TIGR02999 family)